MNSKEKAKELIDRFYQGRHSTLTPKDYALIAVDEIIIAIKFTNDSNHYKSQHLYWMEVKEEINKS